MTAPRSPKRWNALLAAATSLLLVASAAPASAQPGEGGENPDEDLTAPTITISTSPLTAGWSKDSITVTMRTSDVHPYQAKYVLTGATTGTGNVKVRSTQPDTVITISNEGQTTITVNAVDTLENASTETIVVGIDRTQPTIAFTGALGGAEPLQFTPDQTLPARWECGDPRGITSCGARFYQNRAGDGIPLAWDTPLPMVAGTHDVSFYAIDGVGNTYSVVKTYTVANAFEVTGTLTPSGCTRVGCVLSGSGLAFSPAPDAVSYRWVAHDIGPVSDWSASPELTLDAPHVGNILYLQVRAEKTGYLTKELYSSPTQDIDPGFFGTERAARITGTPKVGQELTADVLLSPAPSGTEIEWRRVGSGDVIGTGPTYTPVAADAGAQLQATIRSSRAGYETNVQAATTETIAPATVFRKSSTVTVQAKTKGSTVTVSAYVRITGTYTKPTGKISIRVAGSSKVIKSYFLKNGKATFTLSKQPKGTRAYIVQYHGSDTVKYSSKTTPKLRIR